MGLLTLWMTNVSSCADAEGDSHWARRGVLGDSRRSRGTSGRSVAAEVWSEAGAVGAISGDGGNIGL